ncbi:Mucin-associated surface protein (MASP) subgroup S084 [Trypanosoma cruzi]|uniref:Mucin-associated surface protein (MASP) subgroup S084 n=1 Tax=Trypanosoma cruzi TaxID=5693 RepID=A0A7J6XMB2_TRYCR|nr:Mucin-associated surface protein (MASP) subgroup S084 [Trypanosoma cruzi]
MAMMMTGRVLLVCALCVLWCGAAVVAEGDIGEIGIKDESSKALQVDSQAREAGKKDVRGPEAAVPRLHEQQGKNARKNHGSAIQPTRQVKVEEEEKENEGSLEGMVKDGEILPSPAEGQPTSSEPPPPPAPGGSRNGVISGGGSKLGETSNGGEGPTLNSSSSSGDGNPPAVDSSGSGGGTGSVPGGKEIGGGGTPGVESSKFPVSGVALPPSTPGARSASSAQNLEPSERSGWPEPTVSPRTAPLNVDARKEPKPKGEPQTFSAQGETERQVTDEETSKKEAEESAIEGKRLFNLPHTASSTPAGPAVRLPEGSQVQGNRDEGEGLPPEATKSETSTGQERRTSQSQNESTEPKFSSKDEVAVQHGHVTVPSDSMTNASTNSQGVTPAPSISTNGGDDAQSTVDGNNDDDQRPNSKEAHNNPEDDNTNFTPKFSETAQQTPETVTVVQTYDTATKSNNDGIKAASHTTSPPLLLLLVVACAAAAAVVAA